MKQILVALDSSERSPVVLEAAVQTAKAFGAKLILFRAVNIPVDFPVDAYAISSTDITSSLVDSARSDLEKILSTLPKELQGSCFVEVGTPWQEICSVAQDKKVDLVVIGSHGYNLIDRVLGTTAAKVVNRADCSVLVVR